MDYGGGIYAIGAMKITNSTISNNYSNCDEGGGITVLRRVNYGRFDNNK